MSQAEKILDFDLTNRPFSKAMLLRAATYVDEDEASGEGEVDLSHVAGGGRPFTEAETLDSKVAEAVSIVASDIVTKAMRQLGRSPFRAGESIPKDAPMVVAFALFVLAGLHSGVNAEGHPFDFAGKATDVALNLFLMHSDEEKAPVIKGGIEMFTALARSDLPNVREWQESLMELVQLYVVQWTSEEDDFRNQDLAPMFGSMLRGALSAVE